MIRPMLLLLSLRLEKSSHYGTKGFEINWVKLKKQIMKERKVKLRHWNSGQCEFLTLLCLATVRTSGTKVKDFTLK